MFALCACTNGGGNHGQRATVQLDWNADGTPLLELPEVSAICPGGYRHIAGHTEPICISDGSAIAYNHTVIVRAGPNPGADACLEGWDFLGYYGDRTSQLADAHKICGLRRGGFAYHAAEGVDCLEGHESHELGGSSGRLCVSSAPGNYFAATTAAEDASPSCPGESVNIDFYGDGIPDACVLEGAGAMGVLSNTMSGVPVGEVALLADICGESGTFLGYTDPTLERAICLFEQATATIAVRETTSGETVPPDLLEQVEQGGSALADAWCPPAFQPVGFLGESVVCAD